jgi:4-hydroxy-tetrahydrodipicolinate reductase
MKLAIAGLSGRMGQAIASVADGAHTLIDADDAAAAANAEAMIDFSRPDYSLKMLEFACKHKMPFVSGTTGFSDAQQTQFHEAASTIPVFWASNMSVGVALVAKLVREAAAALPDAYDIEILEMHHRDKVDAPSGTALTLGQAAAKGRGVDFDAYKTLSREGDTGARAKGNIGFATLRGGRVIGDHRVLFAGEHDIIEITHRSQSRAIYAEGALRAAAWLKDQPARFYAMEDLLG